MRKLTEMLLKIGQRPDHGFDEPLGLLSDCHRRIEHFLKVLHLIVREAAGGPLTPAQASQFEGALAYFATAAPRHTADEEESLFPRLKRTGDQAARSLIETLERLEHDHTIADDHHRRVDTLARRWLTEGRLPAGDLAELRGRLAELESLYRAHITVEDEELFPAAARILSRDELRQIGQEMASRRLEPRS